MLKPNEKQKIDENILRYDYIRYSPSEIGIINTAISQISINIPREISVISLLKVLLI